MKALENYGRKLLNTLKKRRILSLSIIFILVVISFYSTQLSVVLISLWVSYSVMNNVLTLKFFSSNTFVAVVSFIAYIAMLQLGVYIGWLINKDTSLFICSIVTLGLMLGLLAMIPKKATPPKRQYLNKFDIIAVCAALLLSIPFFGVPVYKSFKAQENAPILKLVTGAYDDSSHLGMLNDRIQFNKGVLVDTKDAPSSRFSGVGYPAGWHSANAILAKALYPRITPGIESAIYYALNKTFWFIVVSFIFIRTAGSLLASQTKTSFISSGSLLAAGIAALAVFFSDIYILGFYSFIPVILTTLLLLIGSIELYGAKTNKAATSAVVLPILLVSLSTLSWLLVLPMFCLGFAFIALEKFNTSKAVRGWSPKTLFTLAYLFILSAVSTITQITVSGSGNEGGAAGSFVDSILIPGGITIYSIGFYVALAILMTFYILLAKVSQIKPVLLYTTGVILFIGVIYFIQQYRVQYNSYYFYKSLGVFTTIGLTLGVVGVSMALEKLNLKSKITSLAVSIAIPLAIVMLFIPTSVLYTYSFKKDASSSVIYNQLISQLKNNYTMDNYFDKSITIYYPHDNPVLNETGAMFLQANRIHNSCYPILKNASFSVKLPEFDPSIIKNKNCTGYFVTYLVEATYLKDFKQKILDTGLNDTVKVIPIGQK